MSRMFAPVDVDIDTKRHPTETDFITFSRDGVILDRISLSGGVVVFPRGRIITGGTPLTPGQITLAGDWGTLPSVVIGANSNDSRGKVIVHTGSTAPSGSRSWTMTFMDGAYMAAPYALVIRKNDTAPMALPADIAVTTTTLTATVSGAGGADVDDVFTYMLMG